MECLIESNICDYNLNFIVDIGKTTWYSKDNVDFEISPEIKKELPSNQIFTINSLFFNLEKHEREILSRYHAVYNKEENSLSFIITDSAKYSDFSKEIMMNLLEFAQNSGIKTIYLMISRNNKQYIKLLQAMLIVGFESDNEKQLKMINNKSFKCLKMTISESSDEVVEITF